MSSDSANPALHLPARYLAIVQDILRRYLPQAEVWAYGSRVNGDHYDASDLDLVVRQPDNLTRPQPDLDEVAAAFSDSDLPILVQIVDWARIPDAFREEIQADYVVLQPADGATAAATDAHSLAPTLQRGSCVGPLQRPVSNNRNSPPVRRDAGASSLAPTLERGSQTIQSKWLSHVVAELQDGGILLVEDGNHGEYRPRSDEFGQGEYAFIRAADMDGGRVLFESAQLINDTAVKRIRKGIGRGGDVLFSHKGTVGKLALVPLDAPAFVCSPQTTFWRTLKEQTLDRRYLYYFMCSRAFTDQWMARSNETDMAAYVSLTAQRQLSIALPEIAEQRAIADVLDALDDKIEQNRRTAEALERLARVIFRTWFVDFEPVNAKAAGATSFPSMPQPVFDALPTRFVDSEIGPVPAGWRVKPIAGIASFLNGLALQKYPPRGDGKDLRVIKIAELRKGSTEGAGWASADVPEKYLIHDGDLLFSWSGTLEAELWYGGMGALNQPLFKVTSAHYPAWFCLLWIRRHLAWFRAIAASKATTMGHINRSHLQEALVVVPPPVLLDAADRVIGSLYDLFTEVTIESRELARMRDFLLPRLLSGEVRVAAAGESDDHS